MTVLKGVLHASGNIDFPRELNGWAFDRMRTMRGDQGKRIVMKPALAPLEFTRGNGVDKAKTGWLEDLEKIANAGDEANLLYREGTLRLRKLAIDISDDSRIVTLVSQESVDEVCRLHWSRIAWFYAQRHDGFRFDLTKLISMRESEPERPHSMELVARVVESGGDRLSTATFDATGSTAHVNIVEWRGSVAEGDCGRFKLDDTRVAISLPYTRVPLMFLYERRRDFRNHAYHFSGELLEKELKRAFKRAAQRPVPDADDASGELDG